MTSLYLTGEEKLGEQLEQLEQLRMRLNYDRGNKTMHLARFLTQPWLNKS